ncbi:MAG: hypothetical protein FIA93_10340 [Deltaproteobacteria bacterium]|nr:hypothetical protein [Deltaproteobacteria bacterium]PWB68300.1 MAG: hypothetical protein C3F14_00270 [Deltaproteobacteria bacterium]
MRILICIDDTDNLESRGTGHLAAQIARDMEDKGWGKSGFITRHQLLVHPDVPYTSHNSAMCFSADVPGPCLDRLIHHTGAFLSRESAEGSDPGLCVVAIDHLTSPEPLIEFGRNAKRSVVSMEEAYSLARWMGVHLSEHGGSGQGVIGALAGAGLRLSGNDGRVRGHLEISTDNGQATVDDICAHTCVYEVRSVRGKTLSGHERVLLGEKVKAVLLGGKPVLLVVPSEVRGDGSVWQSCSKQRLKDY